MAADDRVLLGVWERAAGQPPARRNMALLAGLSGDTHSVESLPIGEGDRELFRLRRDVFGDVLDGLTDCPDCGARVELGFRISDLDVDGSSAADSGTTHVGDYVVHWRLPRCREIADRASSSNVAAVVAELVDLCLIDVHHCGVAIAALDCPEQVLAAVNRDMASADPFSDVGFDLRCPECGHAWRAPFDIGGFFDRELESRARRLLHDVHRLAAAYGWGEAEILGLTPRRRQQYLDLVD